MANARSKRHHFITRANLRCFADQDEVLTTMDLTNGECFPQSVDVAGAINNYNEVIDNQGEKTDMVEIDQVQPVEATPAY